MSLNDKVEIPRRTMVLFFVIDASGSMGGAKIGAVNTAIEEAIPAIKEVSDENADAQIKIAALEFSSGARWLTAQGPVEADQFRWNYIDAGGVTDLGAAYKALNEKLSQKAFMREASGSYAPVIFLMSDGEPTDKWQNEFELLKQNNWFKPAVKVALAIGDEANKEVLREFTGTMESVLEVHNAAILKKMIKFVSVRSTQIASKPPKVGATNTGDGQKQEDVNAAMREALEEADSDSQRDW
ncbi:MAG: VWA domain-containing protein [Treponema sp.]|jgi:uncharacterized protein YegL|nr:VWA domain-containing protein [Treponema sp.]